MKNKYFNHKSDSLADPIFGLDNEKTIIPKNKLSNKTISPREAYRIVKDELFNEGNARQNLATFTQTYMEDEATLLMSETLEKNAIDKSEYPKTAEIEQRCVDIIANLWNSSNNHLGTSTVGSSEACMLGGLAMKKNWKAVAEKRNLDLNKQRPNLVISSSYQVCWEKFCVYWDIEMRTVPIDTNQLSLNIDKAIACVDDYTIGIVGILGITYTGGYDDIEKLDKAVSIYNEAHEHQLVIHVDAASGGFFTPFIQPDLNWDFRLKNVVSINSSGHKYGLVYPGIGWIIWKNKDKVPQEMIFNVNYLGSKMPTMAINFSRSASQIIAQYYNFLRYGFTGYKSIHQKTKDVALYISGKIKETNLFDIYNDGNSLPIICFKIKDTIKVTWTLYDLIDRLKMSGWQVPAYPLPKDLDGIIISRIVCRADFGFNMAETFIADFNRAIIDLNNKNQHSHNKTVGFTH